MKQESEEAPLASSLTHAYNFHFASYYPMYSHFPPPSDPDAPPATALHTDVGTTDRVHPHLVVAMGSGLEYQEIYQNKVQKPIFEN